jgi:O-succinylbenzoate synthase
MNAKSEHLAETLLTLNKRIVELEQIIKVRDGTITRLEDAIQHLGELGCLPLKSQDGIDEALDWLESQVDNSSPHGESPLHFQ